MMDTAFDDLWASLRNDSTKGPEIMLIDPEAKRLLGKWIAFHSAREAALNDGKSRRRAKREGHRAAREYARGLAA